MGKVYFIRHGEGAGNLDSSLDEDTSPLTPRGSAQAHRAGLRCATIAFDEIVSSTMQRAQQTAQAIEDHTGKPLRLSDLFRERRRPCEEVGVSRDHPSACKARETISENFSVPGFRYSNEENFNDLKERTRQALAYLEECSGNTVVVSHDIFIRVLAAYATFGESLTAQECASFMDKFRMEHTGFSIMRRSALGEDPSQNPWHLEKWNDRTHLDIEQP